MFVIIFLASLIDNDPLILRYTKNGELQEIKSENVSVELSQKDIKIFIYRVVGLHDFMNSFTCIKDIVELKALMKPDLMNHYVTQYQATDDVLDLYSRSENIKTTNKIDIDASDFREEGNLIFGHITFEREFDNFKKNTRGVLSIRHDFVLEKQKLRSKENGYYGLLIDSYSETILK